MSDHNPWDFDDDDILRLDSQGKLIGAGPATGNHVGLLDWTVVVTLDHSSSMGLEKLPSAVVGVQDFAGKMSASSVKLGLVTFCSGVTNRRTPSRDLSWLNSTLTSLRPSGSTNMSAAIEQATAMLPQNGEARRIIMLFTDGAPNNRKRTENAANQAKAYGIEIGVIGTHDAAWDFLDRIASPDVGRVVTHGGAIGDGFTEMADRLLLGPGR